MARDSTVLQLRLDDQLRQAFVDAARRENTTPSRALRALIETFVRESRRKEAQRQSRLVAETSDSVATMEDVGACPGVDR